VEDNTDKVFITTRSSVDYGFEKGNIWNHYLPVNMEMIDEERYIIEPWIKQNFPNANIGYLMYGYYTS